MNSHTYFDAADELSDSNLSLTLQDIVMQQLR